MSLSPEDQERLKRVVLKATALLVGGAVVKYVWQNGAPKAYIYHFPESRTTLIGLLRGDKQPAQFSGQTFDDGDKVDFLPDESNLHPDNITELNQVFERADEEETP